MGAAGDGNLPFENLVRRYSEPQRHYHTLVHIEHCMRELQKADEEGMPYNCEIELALWYHDAVYDPRSSENEELSAQLAISVLTDAGQKPHHIDQVAKYIRATKHHQRSDDRFERMVLDIDLAILGQPEECFNEYERQIREEYAWVPEEKFREARVGILERMLPNPDNGVPSIYQTKYFRALYEAQARENLTRSIQQLRS